jgi:GH24 family phage-related lysozyme (muramidase)
MSDFEIVERVALMIRQGILFLFDNHDPLRMQKSEAAPPPATSAAGLNLSSDAKDLLKGVESLRLKPYDDQTDGDITAWVQGATVGYGHLITKSEWDTYKGGLNQQGADALFDQDLGPTVATVNKAIRVSVKQCQFDALAIFAFNIGREAFSGSSVVKLVNDPNAITHYDDLESAWMAWDKSQGKVMTGLKNRRQCEWNIYSKGIYKRW